MWKYNVFLITCCQAITDNTLRNVILWWEAEKYIHITREVATSKVLFLVILFVWYMLNIPLILMRCKALASDYHNCCCLYFFSHLFLRKQTFKYTCNSFKHLVIFFLFTENVNLDCHLFTVHKWDKLWSSAAQLNFGLLEKQEPLLPTKKCKV